MSGMPRRSFVNSKKLPSSVSIVGLGCSSFSTFYWTEDELKDDANLVKTHPRVQEWIRTITYAVTDVGITLLDTAPWYGHGTSEVVVGWALEDLFRDNPRAREKLMINTKVGRYEADPNKQFDFSKTATLASVQKSLDQLKCGYIDVLQLHDPEFAPSLEQLMNETIPAMMECRETGQCRALGLTGYSLEVQYQIFQQSLELYGASVWDQSLTYGHFNLHDKSLTTTRIANHSSFAEFCEKSKLLLLAAAPFSMGLLAGNPPPAWHPACEQLKQACRDATEICKAHGIKISTLALCVALADPNIPCTIVGMKDVGEVGAVWSVTQRMRNVDDSLTPDEILKQILTKEEHKAWEILRDPVNGPFATVWSNGSFKWDGVQAAREFWKQVDDTSMVEEWQRCDY